MAIRKYFQNSQKLLQESQKKLEEIKQKIYALKKSESTQMEKPQSTAG